MKTLIFATATSGLPIWQAPSEDRSQPHVVDLCARLFEDGMMVDELDSALNPLSIDATFTMEADAQAIHGLTVDALAEVGRPVIEVMEEFAELVADADQIALFAASFQLRMIRIMFAKIGHDDWEAPVPVINIQALASPYTRIAKARPKTADDWKHPSVAEAVAHFTGEELRSGGRARDNLELHTLIARHVKVAGVVA